MPFIESQNGDILKIYYENNDKAQDDTVVLVHPMSGNI